MMVFRHAARFACALGLMIASVTAAGQTPDASPDYATYSPVGTVKAPTDKSDELKTREEVQWRANAIACDRGVLNACFALGSAYELGEGTEQNRPIAAILFGEACALDHADSCYRLGVLTVAANDAAVQSDAPQLFEKSCDLGSLKGCTKFASDLAAQRGAARDEILAHDIWRRTCLAGEEEACRLLANSLLSAERNSYEKSEGLSLLISGCDRGHQASCVSLLSIRNDELPYPSLPPRSDTLALACAAEDAPSCIELADMVFVGEQIARDRPYAYKLYEYSCALSDTRCSKANAMLAEPKLLKKCDDGDMAACGDLGEIYMRYGLVIQDIKRARTYLELACESMQSRPCFVLGDMILAETTGSAEQSDSRAFVYLESSCDTGHLAACMRIADELERGERLPQDEPGAMALLEATCEQGELLACEKLEQRFWTDTDAPLALAGANHIPPLETGDTEGILPYLPEEERKKLSETCSSSTLNFRGKVYSDRVCLPTAYIIGGYGLRPGQAPWQALLWRPSQLSGQSLSSAQRVLCGGSVIQKGWILTAAHCLTDGGGSVKSAGHRIRLGVHNPRANEGVSYSIIEVFPHPSFTRADFAYDIALVKYDPRAGDQGAATNKIARIEFDKTPVSRRTIEAGMKVYTYGWGWTEARNSTSTAELRGAELELASVEECEAITGYRYAALCAQGANGEQACSGDSGGPLITYSDADGVPRVIGVVSAGRKCGTVGEKSRYTRVGTVRSWIARTIAANQ